MIPWKTVTRRQVFERAPFLRLELHQVQLPDGRLLNDWPWIITPDYVNVVAVTPEQKILCFRQTKYAVQGVSLAAVGGLLEPEEDPQAGAKRELLEETGYSASAWMPMGRYAVDANRGAGNAWFFLAREAVPTAPRQAGDLEEQELLFLTPAEIRQALADGQFKVLAWAAIMSLGLAHL